MIPTLQAQGHFVVAEQNALTSLADDVATTRQILAEIEGPTLLVGHSYGSFVISEAANDAPGVVGLVYISAFMLDEGKRCSAPVRSFLNWRFSSICSSVRRG